MSSDLGKVIKITFEYENGTVTYNGVDAERAKSQIDSAFTLTHVHGFKYSTPEPIITYKEAKNGDV
jgi:hypothetical protein